METGKRVLVWLAMAFVGVPLLVNFIALIVGLLWLIITLAADSIPVSRTISDTAVIPIIILGAWMTFICGRIWARENAPEPQAGWRDCVLLLPALLMLLGWVVLMHDAKLDIGKLDSYGIASVAIWPWLLPNAMSLLHGWIWGALIIPVGSQICFALGYGGARWRILFGDASQHCRNMIVFLLLIFGAGAAYQAYLYAETYSSEGDDEYLDFRDYQASTWGDKLTSLRGRPAFQIAKNWPRLDGATAALPLYASAFYGLTLFPEDTHPEDYLYNQGTSQAYENIIRGKADIIFVAQPSVGQKQLAEAAGVKLTYTPFAREAFVFIVNQNNPVRTLSDAQIRGIYSGAITNWHEVGGDNNAIQSWQRPENSGSQTAMLAKVMKETRMISPQRMNVATAMGELVNVVAEYRNTHNSIGYTFRYYATQMHGNTGIKLLAINGIAPTVENIHNGTYPYTVDVYMVTREHPSAETQKLVDWFISPQGQRLVQDVGYVPLLKVQD